MKRGFTLIELLIIMIIVGVLTAIALPKYQRALERGRALEGLHNVRAAADYINAKYLAYAVNGQGYSAAVTDYENVGKSDLIRSRFFNSPVVSSSSANGAVVTIQRKEDTGWSYSLVATSVDGDIVSIECDGNEATCSGLDLIGNLVTRR